jgi:hypothetical protein
MASAPSRANASEQLGAEEPNSVKGSTRSLALLGGVVVAGLAAVWATELAVQSPSATVTLPPARMTFHTPAALPVERNVATTTIGTEHLAPSPVTLHASQSPRAAQNIAVATARARHPEGTFARAGQVRLEPARSTSDGSALPDINASKGSRYTSLEPAACTIVHNADLTLRRCPGVAGYALDRDDARPADYFAIVGPAGERSELGFSRIAPGGSLGKLAEWRAGSDGDPRALIVRVSLPGKDGVSSLIVAKLDAAPCVVAVIPRGPHQNEKARRVADLEQLECSTG